MNGGRRLLDYGSGFGRWAIAAVLEGFEVTAYEPAISRGTEGAKCGFELLHDAALLSGRKFDAINLEQVLEHVPDPLSVLQEIRGLCAPGAIVRITVPNIYRTNEGAELWRDWPYNGQRVHTMAPFEHLHGFTPISLLHVVRWAGFESLPMSRLILQYPLLALRSWTERWIPALGNTYMIVRPTRAKGGDFSHVC
jgi:SAM-dependent methyltransferase